jgi:hypothetical protein
LLTDLLLGRVNDRATTRWQGMFLPENLRAELQTHLHSSPEVVYARQRPLVIGPSYGGALLLVPLGLVLLGGVIGLRALGRWRLAATLAGGVLGLCGMLVFGVVAVSALPELRYNEAALLCLPTDLLLLGLQPEAGVRYARLRLLGLLAAAAALMGGLLAQPLWPVVALYALPLAGLALPLRPQGSA